MMGGISIKKGLCFLIISLSCLLICSCNKGVKEEYPCIDWNSTELNETMINYHNTDSCGFTQGKYFEAKLLECYKIKHDQSTFYYYNLVIAPRTIMPIANIKVAMNPAPLLADYFSKFKGNMGMGSDNDWGAEFKPMKSISELIAIQYKMMWNNKGDDKQTASGIKPEAFDTAMTEITIEIRLNNNTYKDTLILKLDDKLISIDNPDNPLIAQNQNIQDLLINNKVNSSRGSFWIK